MIKRIFPFTWKEVIQVAKMCPIGTDSNALDFLENLSRMPMPIQRVRTNCGREFFASKMQKKPME